MSGSWNIIEAIVSRWGDKSLDEAIRAMWSDPSEESHYFTLYEDEAEEGAPRPYVVFEHAASTDVEQMSCEDTAKVYAIATGEVNFRVHAVNKTQAVDIAKLIVAAFDNARFSAGESHVLGMARYADFGSRDGDEGYLWSVRYRVKESHVQVISA